MTTLSALLAATVLATHLALPQAVAQTPPAAKQGEQAAKPAAPKPLRIGDPAPAFNIESWVKGEPFDTLEKGKVHVLEFWATWCGPCIAAMPHLTELQKKYPEVRFVGVASSERGADNSAKLEKVKKFVADKGDGMGYRVVYVGDRAKMSTPWMEAAGKSGIPCSFIVDAVGRVAWIGHPMDMDGPLEQIVKGEFDLAKAAAEAEKERAAALAQRAVLMSIRDAQKSGDYAPVVTAIKEALEKAPSDGLRITAVQVLAGPAKRPSDAWPIAEEILAKSGDSAMAMNQLAWILVDPAGAVAEPNLDIAMRAAQRACELTKNEDGSILDTLARVHFVKGDIARAIEVQTQAVAKAADAASKAEMEKTLSEYEAKTKKG